MVPRLRRSCYWLKSWQSYTLMESTIIQLNSTACPNTRSSWWPACHSSRICMQVCWTSTPSHLNMTVRLINGNSLNAYSLICRLCPETPCDTGQEQIVCTWFSVETQNKSNVCLAMPPIPSCRWYHQQGHYRSDLLCPSSRWLHPLICSLR